MGALFNRLRKIHSVVGVALVRRLPPPDMPRAATRPMPVHVRVRCIRSFVHPFQKHEGFASVTWEEWRNF